MVFYLFIKTMIISKGCTGLEEMLSLEKVLGSSTSIRIVCELVSLVGYRPS